MWRVPHFDSTTLSIGLCLWHSLEAPFWSGHRGPPEIFAQRLLPLKGGLMLINLPLFDLSERGHVVFGEDVASVYQLDIVLPPFFEQCLGGVGPPLRQNDGAGRGISS